LTHNAIVRAESPTFFANDAALRPLCTSSTIWRLKSGVYRTVLSAIANPSKPLP
jgi:hypothetical protein